MRKVTVKRSLALAAISAAIPAAGAPGAAAVGPPPHVWCTLAAAEARAEAHYPGKELPGIPGGDKLVECPNL